MKLPLGTAGQLVSLLSLLAPVHNQALCLERKAKNRSKQRKQRNEKRASNLYLLEESQVLYAALA